jgi:hypothetical protein
MPPRQAPPPTHPHRKTLTYIACLRQGSQVLRKTGSEECPSWGEDPGVTTLHLRGFFFRSSGATSTPAISVRLWPPTKEPTASQPRVGSGTRCNGRRVTYIDIRSKATMLLSQLRHPKINSHGTSHQAAGRLSHPTAVTQLQTPNEVFPPTNN